MSPARLESPCNTCINLFRNASSRDPILSSISGYVCSRIRLELENAADLGCPLCEYVVRQDLRYPWIWPKNFHYILRNHDGPRPSSWPPGDEEISYSVRLEPERRNCIQIQAVKGMDFGNMAVVFLVFARQDDPASRYIPQRPVNQEVGSTQSFSLARRWIHQCLTEHADCLHPKHSPLPPRIVEVSPSDNPACPRLRSAEGQQGSYAALSYCWGGPQEGACMEALLSSYTQELPLPKLPQVIRDAITATQALQIPFLWIDSLCIVQDSPSDKEYALPLMGSIYRNSTVTISAACASSCHESFLHKRLDINLGPEPPISTFSLPFHSPDESGMGSITLQPYAGRPTIFEPLHHRAWTLQETLLSPRVLLYSAFGLLWRCNRSFHTDGGHLTWSTYTNMVGLPSLRLSSVHSGSSGPSRSQKISATSATNVVVSRHGNEFTFPVPPHSTFERQEWQEVLSDYTRRQMSSSTDKLPALSALAAEYAVVLHSRYLAGLWENWLPFELMWIRTTNRTKQGPEVMEATRPNIWRGPSWSWVAIDGKIGFKDMGLKEFTPHCEVLECNVTLSSPLLLFGEVSSASLVIRAPLKEVLLHHCEPGSAQIVINGLDEGVKVYFDVVEGEMLLYPVASQGWPTASSKTSRLPDGRDVQVWRLILGVSIEKRKPSVEEPVVIVRRAHGLLLARAGERLYQRFGWFQTSPHEDQSEWFVEDPLTTLTIV